MIDIERLRAEIIESNLSRRDVLRRTMALGLSAPVIAALLAACGGDDDDDGGEEAATEEGGGAAEETATEATEATETEAESAETEAATGTEAEATETEPEGTAAETEEEAATGTEAAAGERGGAGDLQLLWWQAPTILNTHYSQGTKDNDASRPILEPLLEVADDGTLLPVLATEVPSLDNGLLAEDGMSVTWKLREGVTWHDGEEFNAEDVKFTYDWVLSEGNVTTTLGSYEPVDSVEIVDDYTVTVTFKETNPAWMDSGRGRIIPEHIMKDYMGAQGTEAPFNLSPTGTGPYKIVEFKPGDVVTYEINMDYWQAGKPHFDTVTMKGGGDATSAARAAIQTGEVDYAWNLQVEAEVLNQLSQGEGPGELLTPQGLGVERMMINFANPRQEVDGAFSEPSTEHPWQTDPAVRQAYMLLANREIIASQLYGPAGEPTSNWLAGPESFVSPNTSFEFNPEKAAQTLEDAGWVLQDGVRTKGDVQIGILYQTSINTVRQKTQEIVKQAFEEVGMPVEIKAIEASVYFSSDAGNPDTASHFYADIEMYTNSPGVPYPISYAEEGLSLDPATDIPQKSNGWSGNNYCRWVNEEYNQTYATALTELDPEKQAELFIKMNDLMVNNGVHIPLVLRADVSAKAKNLDIGQHSRWTSELYNLVDWQRTE